jgi:hypothetical protein
MHLEEVQDSSWFQLAFGDVREQGTNKVLLFGGEAEPY